MRRHFRSERTFDDGVHAAGDAVHAVRDFVLVKVGSWSWPNFNVADSLLVCGAILLFWHAFRCPCEAKKHSPSEESAGNELANKIVSL